MFRRRRKAPEISPATAESLEQAQAARHEQEAKAAGERPVRNKLARIQGEDDVARLLRIALGGRP